MNWGKAYIMRKNSNFKLIIGLISGILIGSVTVVGANQAIQAMQNTEIKVSLNGQVQEFKDETTGEKQYPITYHNRTYLPLRNVAQLSGLEVNYDSNTNTALLSTYESEAEDDNEYFWDYKTIAKYAYLLNTSAYDEIHDKYIILKKSDIGQNTLASLINKYGEEKGFELFESFCLESSYYLYPGGDDTGFIEKEVNYDEDSRIYIYKPINIKFAQVHEDMINNIWMLIKDPDNYMKNLRESYEESVDSNDSAYIKYYDEEIQKNEKLLEEMHNDEIISNIRQKYEDFYDLTIEEKAHCAKYTTGYWDRPEDANYSLNRIFIMNGNNSTKDYYNCYGRAKKIKLTVNGKEFFLDLEDTPECQVFDINYTTNEIFKPLDITLEVLEKYTGTGHTKTMYSYDAGEEVYISDIQFDVNASVFVGGR